MKVRCHACTGLVAEHPDRGARRLTYLGEPRRVTAIRLSGSYSEFYVCEAHPMETPAQMAQVLVDCHKADCERQRESVDAKYMGAERERYDPGLRRLAGDWPVWVAKVEPMTVKDDREALHADR